MVKVARFYESDSYHRLRINRITGERFPKQTICGRKLKDNRAELISVEEAEYDYKKCRRCYGR